MLQLPNAADCNRSVAHCVTCRFTTGFGGSTATKAVCLGCEAGYVVKQKGRKCWCGPGYYLNADSGNCEKCGYSAFCPGAKATQASGAARTECGQHKNTTTQYAVSAMECVVDPGYGWADGDAAEECPIGTYNPGFNTRRCTRCSGGLTTNGTGSISSMACWAPPGYYYQRGAAEPCSKGTYKEDIGNDDCLSCPDGFTTELGKIAKTSHQDCKYVLPGWSAPAAAMLGTTAGSLCPVNTYRSGEAVYDSAAGTNCTQCPEGLQTQEEGGTSVDACLVPPGYGWNVSSATAYPCPLGYFNDGWNKEPCTRCGLGSFTTENMTSKSSDYCMIPAGHRTVRSADGLTLTGEACPIGTYGDETPTYGLVDTECITCLEHMTTNTTGSVSSSACFTLPGYGYAGGEVLMCGYGYYSYGFTRDGCAFCGDGHNTTVNGSLSVAPTVGADSEIDCVIAAGYTTDGSGGVKPCLRGYYKDGLGPATCDKCPNATTTTLTTTAIMLSDCNACRPGFGATSIDLTNPACTMCGSGFWSPGNVANGEACKECPRPAGFTGNMVSRKGLTTPEYCTPEFTNDGADSQEAYDIIPMSDDALTLTSDDTAAACQAACTTDCQYFAFYSYKASGSRCYLRNKVPYSGTIDTSDVTKSYALFKATEMQYVAYLAHASDATSLGGDTPLGSFATRELAQAACDSAQLSCIGIKHVSTDAAGTRWKTFAGIKWEGAVGKVKAVGDNLNPWIADPSYN